MTLEKTAEETQWIFRYLRADREEIDMGPYETQQKAQEERDNMASFGAMCSPPIEVSKGYKLYQGRED
jgi:hypothetical protein